MNRLRVGIALHNAGHYLAAHEPLEELWLEAPAGERDDCLQGLIQAAAAVHKARIGNESGAAGLAESARGYLEACEAVAVDALAEWLAELAADPARGDRDAPPKLRLDGEAVGLYDLAPAEILAAAEAVAEAEDDDLLEAAVEYAEPDSASGSDPLVALLVDRLAEPTPTVRQRLREHVDRRRRRTSDVDGLF